MSFLANKKPRERHVSSYAFITAFTTLFGPRPGCVVVDPRITDSAAPKRKTFVPEFRPAPLFLIPPFFLCQAIEAYFICDVLHYDRADARAIVAYVRALLRRERQRERERERKKEREREKHIERNLCVGETSNRTAQSGRISPRLELINSNK